MYCSTYYYYKKAWQIRTNKRNDAKNKDEYRTCLKMRHYMTYYSELLLALCNYVQCYKGMKLEAKFYPLKYILLEFKL